jgi:hypothetical protein
MTDGGDSKSARADGAESDQALREILPPELANKIPAEVRSEVVSFFMRSGPTPHPLARVITEQHIDKAMDYGSQADRREFDYACGNRRYLFVVFCITLVAVGFVLYFFREKPEVFTPILTAILGFASGFGLGKRV